MSTVLRREPPFRTIFGYATLFGEDGRPMHKSWGNAIEFDEAAERMGVDVMRWMFVHARPDDNILFGWHAADEARRELLVLWNVYAFFVAYARLAGWAPGRSEPPVAERRALDRWILSRTAALAVTVEDRLRDYDAAAAARAASAYIDELSTWYLRLSRRRFSRSDDRADRAAAFATLHAAIGFTARVLAPMLPFMTEAIHRNLTGGDQHAPVSVHLASWPAAELADRRDPDLEAAMGVVRRAVDLVRTLRGNAGIRIRQPLRRAWLALPDAGGGLDDELLRLMADEVNVKVVEIIGDESDLVDRRVKPLLPVIGRKLGPRVPEVMAAAREGRFEILADGAVQLAGVTLAPEEVEILAVPRPGTAVAHDDGLVVIVDTELTPELLAEGDARELTRAIQDLRREAELELADRIDVWLDLPDSIAERLRPFLPAVAADTLADGLAIGPAPGGASVVTVTIDAGEARVALRRRGGDR